MSLANLVCNSLGTLLDSPVITYLGNMTGKPVLDILKNHFSFTALEITQAYQKSYVQILSAIRLGLRASTWKKLLSNNVKREFAHQILKDYFKPFVETQHFSNKEFTDFALKIIKTCQLLIKYEKDLFKLREKDLELGLVQITNPHESWKITALLLDELSMLTTLDQDIVDFFRYKELLGHGLLYFFHEQLRQDERLQTTFLALQQEGLWIDLRNMQKAQQQILQIVNQQHLQVKPPQVLYQIQQRWEQQLGDFQVFSLQFKGFVDVISERLEMIANNIDQLHSKTDQILALLLELKQKEGFSDQQVVHLIKSTEQTLLKTKPVLITTPLEKTINLQTVHFNSIQLDKHGKMISSIPCKAKQFTEDLGKGIALEMIYVVGGRFLMGASPNELGIMADELPQHWVEIEDFFISKYPISQMQWFLLMKQGLSCQFNGANLPVEKVSWFQALDFCRQLSKKADKSYRLPTEAEWEYACRAGTLTAFHFGETITTDVANYDGNYDYNSHSKNTYKQMTTPIGTFPPNRFGLCDMHGNVWEWTCSEYREHYGDQSETKILKQHQAIDKRIVVRGGSWYSSAVNCRSANRYHVDSKSWDNDIGFRIALSVNDKRGI
ncbi:MAG: hypothetical protein RIT27_1134 [Pseudomonadota bacterium]|jgi:formylglycine-generating enzyme required for sulfatase activity